jgi:hypothetical protein
MQSKYDEDVDCSMLSYSEAYDSTAIFLHATEDVTKY